MAMKLGFFLPNIGPVGSPEAIIRVARRAEELGYDSLWVTERLIYPVKPQSPYPATADGSLPEGFKTVIDPLHALTFAAAHTSRIALGTSVMVMSYRNPLLLAKELTAIDVLSGGRLKLGMGQGWSKDEFDATGTSMGDRAARADEVIQVLKAVWTTDPVEFHGKFFNVPRCHIDPKPVQKPHPPIYLAAYSSAAMKRLATEADGWHPAGIPAEGMAQMMEGIRGMAREAGRKPSDLKLVVRTNLHVSPEPLGEGRWIFSGSLGEIKSDIQATRNIGADELLFDPTHSPDGASTETFLKSMERMKQLAEEA